MLFRSDKFGTGVDLIQLGANDEIDRVGVPTSPIELPMVGDLVWSIPSVESSQYWVNYRLGRSADRLMWYFCLDRIPWGLEHLPGLFCTSGNFPTERMVVVT